jgi:hypothetical protein
LKKPINTLMHKKILPAIFVKATTVHAQTVRGRVVDQNKSEVFGKGISGLLRTYIAAAWLFAQSAIIGQSIKLHNHRQKS